MNREDVALLAAVVDGDVPAFEELYRRYHRRLAGFLFRMTGRPAVVEELVNDVMWVVWQKAGSFAGRSQVSTWIMGVAYRKALKAVERFGRTPTLVEIQPQMLVDEDGGESVIADIERQRRIRQALTELTAPHRAVVELAYYHDCSYAEIAEIVGCPENTVKTRMFHARKKLRRLLSQAARGGPAQEERTNSR